MRINPVNYNIQQQNFKGIISRDEKLKQEMLGENEEIIAAALDAKDIDICLFGAYPDSKQGNKFVPAYVGIVQSKKDGTSGLAGFKCPKTEEGLKRAQQMIKNAVIWANAPANFLASGSIEGLGKNKKQQEYVSELQNNLNKAACTHEAKVWKQKLDIMITRDDKNLE